MQYIFTSYKLIYKIYYKLTLRLDHNNIKKLDHNKKNESPLNHFYTILYFI